MIVPQPGRATARRDGLWERAAPLSTRSIHGPRDGPA